MGSPRYSIITACLNAQEELKKTLYSIEQQTYLNFEWIIVDGQSKDDTVDVVRNHPCVTHLVSEPDQGIYDAMNKGVELACGEYLLFLNAGDWLFSKQTLKEVDSVINDDVSIGQLMALKQGRAILKNYEEDNIDKCYLYSRTLPHQSTFIRRKLFDRYGLYCKKFRIKGDHDFFARLAINGVSFSFLPICISYYPVNGLSSKMKHSKLLKEELEIVRKRNFSITYKIKMRFLNFFCMRMLLLPLK